MRDKPFVHLVGAVALWVLLLPSPGQVIAASSSSQSTTVGASYSTTSWALGVVVPEGAGLQGGGGLRWETVSNITALVTLPMISRPDRSVYAVLSVMTEDGSVLQAAAGVSANGSEWLAYSWLISDMRAAQLSYDWVLNASGPQMPPGSQVSFSIFRGSDRWNLKIAEAATGSSTEQPFPSGISASIKVGDQEVFAFESYSRAVTTFNQMGNLTLNGLFVDGRKVIGGSYSFSDWDMIHNPVFVVGSSGTSPPTFISFRQAGDGSSTWSYSGVWGGSGGFSVSGEQVILALMLLVSLFVVVLAFSITRRKDGSGTPRLRVT